MYPLSIKLDSQMVIIPFHTPLKAGCQHFSLFVCVWGGVVPWLGPEVFLNWRSVGKCLACTSTIIKHTNICFIAQTNGQLNPLSPPLKKHHRSQITRYLQEWKLSIVLLCFPQCLTSYMGPEPHLARLGVPPALVPYIIYQQFSWII